MFLDRIPVRLRLSLGHAIWMVVVFLLPVLAGIGVAKCAPWSFVLTAAGTVVPLKPVTRQNQL